MFKNVVVGLKEGLEHAPLLQLVRMAVQPPGAVHLVTLVRVGVNEDETVRLRGAEQHLHEHADRLRDDGYRVTVTAGLVVAAAATDLLRIVRDQDADLLVVGLAKRSRVGKALMGSDAQRALLGATCPVLVAHTASK